MTATKKKPKKAAPKAKKTDAKKPTLSEIDAELTQALLAMREDAVPFGQMAKELNITVNKIQMLLLKHDLKPKDRIKGSEEEIAAQIAAARDEQNQSWAMIIARTGLSMGKCKKLYTQHTGKEANQGYAAVSRRSAERPENVAKEKRKVVRKVKAATKANAKTKVVRRKKRINPSKG